MEDVKYGVVERENAQSWDGAGEDASAAILEG